MKKTSILFSIIGSFAFATGNDQSNILKGALILDDPAKVRKEHVDPIEGVQFEGIALPEQLAAILADYPITKDGAEGLCQTIASYYEANNEYRFSVRVPEQDTSNGVVQLVVAPEKLGTVHVKQNEFTDSEALIRWVRIAENEPINQTTVKKDLGWMNSNPYRSVKVAYEATENPGVTDLDLIVTDKKSWKVSTGVDNSGNMPIGTTRIFGTIDVNDFIFSDHTLNLKATVADHFSEYQSYTATYVAPLPWRNTLTISGSWSGTAPNRTGYPQKHRQSYRASARYEIPQWFGENLWVDQLTWEAGFDFKGANSNLIYEDDPAPVDKRLAYIGQFTGSLNAVRKGDSNKISAGIDLVGSPARMLPNQTEADFENLRAGSSPVYVYSRVNLSLDQSYSNWKLLLKGRAQLSPSTLIPSEQFSLGGYSTVRGYQERVVGGDNSFCGNLEVSTPKLTPVKIWVPSVNDHLTLLGFIDAGYAWFNDTVENRPNHEALLGVGTGLRYSVASNFTTRLDVGFPLMKVQKDDSGSARVHFNTSISY